METLIRASQFLLSLSLLIVLHELGHFIPARLFGTRVEKFYLFFDYKYSLFKKKIGDTVYGIGWIPLGGYVKISGMIDESMDTEQMKEEPKPWEFRSKPAWQRLIIMLGGVTVNFILGILIYIMILFVWGREYVSADAVKEGFSVAEVLKPLGFKDGDQILKVNGEVPFDVLDINADLLLKDIKTIEVKHLNGQAQTINLPEDIGMQMWTSGDINPFIPRIFPVIDTVMAKLPAEKAGFKKNDKIIAINGMPVKYWDQFTSVIKKDTLNPVNVVVSRDGVEKTLTVQAEKGKIGVGPVGKYPFKIETKMYTFGESIPAGTDLAINTLDNYIGQFKYLATAKGASSLGGFLSIAKGFSPTWDWRVFWSFTAFLSIMLAFMNLLPIPALDGGHVVFTLFEMITGRKPNEKFLEYAQVVGFIILVSLLLYANGNDVYKWLVTKGIF